MDIHQTFSGGVFCDSIEGGRASAQIQLTGEGIAASAHSGEQFLLPYRECNIEIGGASDRTVFCRNPDRSLTIYCDERAFPKTLAEASMGLLDHQIKNRQTLQRREIWTGRGWLVAFLVGCAVLLVVGTSAFEPLDKPQRGHCQSQLTSKLAIWLTSTWTLAVLKSMTPLSKEPSKR